IQGAIDTVADGGTVVVAAGVYPENIAFHGKAAVVRSADGPATVIEGTGVGPAIEIQDDETRATVVQGFTIRHGGPGIHIGNAAGSGGAVDIDVGPISGPDLLANSFLDNRADRGTAVFSRGDYFAANNVITGPPTGPAVSCEGTAARLFFNDVYNGTPTPFRY